MVRTYDGHLGDDPVRRPTPRHVTGAANGFFSPHGLGVTTSFADKVTVHQEVP